MQPVTIEARSTPPQLPNKISVGAEKTINFVDTLHPYVQLLLAIVNAVFLPSFCAFHDLTKKLTPSQKIFAQTINPPAPPSTAQVEEEIKEDEINDDATATFKNKIAQLNDSLAFLEGRFTQDQLIVEDMNTLALINREIKQLSDQHKALASNTKKGAVQEESATLLALSNSLQDQIDDYYVRKGELILTQFERILDVFAKLGKALPNGMREELLETWKCLDSAMRPRLSHLTPPVIVKQLTGKLNELKKNIEKIKNVSQHTPVSEPLKLRNIGNSCYMDSVLQALMCVEAVCDDLHRPLLPPEPEKLAIQKEILQFLKVQPSKRALASQIGLVLCLLEQAPSPYRLREAICKSNLSPDLTMTSLKDQHDAAAVMRILLDFLPHCRFKTQLCTSTNEFPGLEFNAPLMDMTMLTIPLRPPEYQQLKTLIHWVMYKRYERASDPKDQRLFDPKDGKIVDKIEGAKSQAAPPQKVNEFIEWTLFKELPSVMVLHFGRFQFNTSCQKDDRPVDLPQDGIVDLSRYYDVLDVGTKQVKYKIKSFVAHKGDTLDSGHYLAYVETDGKYYCCDDLTAKAYEEITEKEFYGRQDAYLMVLEKLPGD